VSLPGARAAAASVIAGVSLATDGRRPDGDQFDIALSHEGIEIRRPGQETRQLSWHRVSEWEVRDRRDGVLLTLRGPSGVTSLVVPGRTADELQAALRDATAPSSTATAPEQTALDVPVPAAVDVPVPAAVDVPVQAAAGAEPGAEPQQETRGARQGRRRLSRWKVVVTVTLLAALATAVTLVMLQSAGIIHLSILGPTA
jgi:hypothetical protein